MMIIMGVIAAIIIIIIVGKSGHMVGVSHVACPFSPVSVTVQFYVFSMFYVLLYLCIST